MYKPTYEQAAQYEKDYSYIPVCREILADDITTILVLRKLASLDNQYFLLESAEGGRLGRYSFLGYHPKLSVFCKHGVVKQRKEVSNMIQEATKKVVENRNLTEEEAEQVMNEIMTGQAAESNMAAFLTALRIKGETVEEISAFAKGMGEAGTKLTNE